MMEGLILEALAAERIRDLEREVIKRRRARKARKARRPRYPDASWVLSGTLPTWLR